MSNRDFKHGSLNLVQKNKLIFTSFSKRNFYLRSEISAFVLKDYNTPISPFMNFDYNLSGLVNKDLIRIANNTLIKKSDEVWVFGEISDGVLVEIYLARQFGKPVHYYGSNEYRTFEEINQDQARLEDVSPWM